jgi:PAS domain S-box-containing protein
MPQAFLATADLLPEPMLLVNADGVIEAANRAFAARCGLERESLVSRRLEEFVTETGSTVTEYLRACARSGQPVLGALTLSCGGDTTSYRCDGVAHRGLPERGDERTRVMLRLRPKPEGVSGFVTLTDRLTQLNAQIRQREATETLLKRQRETLEVTLASIGDAVVVTDAEGRVTFLNAVAESLTGWPLREANGRPLGEVFHVVNERTRSRVEDPVAKVLQEGRVVGLANHSILIGRDGREVPVDDSAAPIYLPNRELFGVVLIFRDITEHKQAFHTRAWLAAIIESSDDAIVSKTLDGRINSWNLGAQRVFGYTADEIVGKPITTIIPQELHSEEREILARLAKGQRIEHFDTVRVRKDGTRVEVSITISPIRDDTGSIVGASKIARDITERRRFERALLEADRRKDEFLATLAHELRNPLAPVRNATALLCSTDLQPAARSACEIIDRQVRHMTHLVDDLLDMARITAGRVRLQTEPLDLAEILAIAIEACRPGLDSAKHEFTLELPPDPIYVRGDRVRLPQVFGNVIGNAIKYTPPGGKVHMMATREGATTRVSIRDTGIGIPVHMLESIFDLFAQADRAFDRTGGGLGIGLTLARRLLEMHGGTIEARSAGAGKGSEFIVSLPVIEQGPVRRRAGMTAAKPSGRRKVLIADDNHDGALSFEMLVKLAGHETRIAHDGLEALEIAEVFHPDIAFIDIGMPRLDGYQTARRMAARPWAASTRLIAVTGWGQEADKQRAIEAGFHRHLVKPVDPELLTEVLAEELAD